MPVATFVDGKEEEILLPASHGPDVALATDAISDAVHPFAVSVRPRVATIAIFCFAAWTIGQVFRDASWLTGLFFFIPSPVAAAGLWIGAWFIRGTPNWSRRLMLLSCAPACMVLLVENHWWQSNPPPTNQPTFRLLHWNVLSGHWGTAPVLERAVRARPDMIFLSEPPWTALKEQWSTLLPDYQSLGFRGMWLAARGTLRRKENLVLSHPLAAAAVVEWQYDGRTVRVVIADLPSSLLVPRDPLLQELREACVRTDADFLIGDLNSPRRSWGLNDWPTGYQHAYTAAGSGWSYTWPGFCPLWAIDQCICGPRIVARNYKLETSWFSDHCLQEFEFQVQ